MTVAEREAPPDGTTIVERLIPAALSARLGSSAASSSSS